MRQEQRDREFYPGFVFSLVFTLLNIYAMCIALFADFGLAPEPALRFLRTLYSAGLIDSEYPTKGIAVLFIVMTFIVRNGVGEDVTWKRCLFVTGIGLALYLFPYVPALGNIPYIVFTLAGYVVLSKGIKMIAGKFSSFKRRQNDPYESFQQNEILVSTPTSMNLRMRYYWKGRWRHGWINLIEQRRHTFVCGIPGSGKTYSIIEEQLIQDIEKGYGMFVYDFKYPDLSTLVYNVWSKNRHVYKEKYKNDDNFLVVNFKDPRYSDRCNPLDPMYIRTLSDAMEAAQTILNDLNPNKDKGDKFFDGSANIYIAGLIWQLRIYRNGLFCSFPHLIEMVSYDYKKVLELAKRDPQMKGIFQSFIDADAKKAEGQIMGQIASARIPLMNMVDSHLYWVMSINDVPLDLNNAKAPKVMCIGNVPDKVQVTSTAISLIASRMFKQVNTFKGAPLNINIDECTTFHATGMDTTMATCRSKDIGFTIAVQDPNQMFRDWGEKEAKAIMGNLGNQFFGQSLGDYNRHISELLGKEYREHQSLSNGDSDSVSTSFQLEERASVRDLANLSQGEFIGFAADNVEHPNTLKQFHCFIETDNAKRKMYRDATKGIPKNERMKAFFRDAEIEEAIKEDPDAAIMKYFTDEVNAEELEKKKREKNYTGRHENLIQMDVYSRINKLSPAEKNKLLEKIIDMRQSEAMEEVLNEHQQKIRDDIESIFLAEGISKPAVPMFGTVS